MSNGQNSELTSYKNSSFETVKSIAITLLFLICTWLYNSQQRLEDRFYQLSSTAVTDQKAAQLEQRISASIETRFQDLSSRLDLLLKLVSAQQQSQKEK